MEKFVCKAIKLALGSALGSILGLMLFFQSMEYFHKTQPPLDNWVILLLLLVGAALARGICLLCKGSGRIRVSRQSLDWDRLCGQMSIILFFVQVFVFYHVYFLTDWDAWAIRATAQQLAAEGNMGQLDYFREYYSRYPNNLVMVYLSAALYRLNHMVGVFSGIYSGMPGVVVNCLLNSLSCWLVYKTARLFVGKKTAFAGYCLAILSVGISPWSVIFYSDSLGLIVPILSFYLYARPEERSVRRGLCRCLSAAIATLGYFIKPQCLILLIAIFAMEAVGMLSNFRWKKLLKPGAMLLSCVVCFAVVSVVMEACSARVGMELDSERAFGMSHYLMMGLNEKKNGTYAQADVDFSDSFATAAERSAANLKEVGVRLKEMGVAGYLRHLVKKALVTFNDGTFAWGAEGEFFVDIPQRSGLLTDALRSFYYCDGAAYGYFLGFAQTVWLLILLLVMVSCFRKGEERTRSRESVLRLSLVGLILFELLFEARARYLYAYIPVFCTLAALGLDVLSRKKSVLK